MRIGALKFYATKALMVFLGFVIGSVLNIKGQSDTSISLIALALMLAPGIPPVVKNMAVGILLSTDWIVEQGRKMTESIVGGV